jgi:hypothetical protein
MKAAAPEASRYENENPNRANPASLRIERLSGYLRGPTRTQNREKLFYLIRNIPRRQEGNLARYRRQKNNLGNPMSLDPKLSAFDYLNADRVLQTMSANLEIEFNIAGEDMAHDEAKKHFKKREALLIVRNLLIFEAERVINDK